MKAARFYGVGDLRIEDIAPPSALPDDAVRVRVLAAGICGSDLHNFRTGQWIGPLPVTPGHEFCGEVLAIGSAVSRFVVGDRVVADSRVGCGHCAACQSGRHNLCRSLGFVGEVCDGGFAEQVQLPASRLLRVPDTLPAAIAALSEPLGVALRVVNQLNPPPGEPVLIAGGGTIGGLVALLLHHLRGCPLLVAESNPLRLTVLSQVLPLQAVELDHDLPLAAAYAVEATGVTGVLNQLINLVTPGGRIAMVGLFHGQAAIDANKLVEREISLIGCSVFADEQRSAISLLPQLAGELAHWISRPIPLDALPDTYRQLLAGRVGALKTLVVP